MKLKKGLPLTKTKTLCNKWDIGEEGNKDCTVPPKCVFAASLIPRFYRRPHGIPVKLQKKVLLLLMLLCHVMKIFGSVTQTQAGWRLKYVVPLA